MPESIDWPPTHRPMQPPRRRRFLLIFVVLAVIFFGARTALSYYVDVLWFGSLGYGDVFWKTLSLQWGIFAFFTAATFLDSVWIVPGAEAGASSRFAEWPHDFHWRTATEAAG